MICLLIISKTFLPYIIHMLSGISLTFLKLQLLVVFGLVMEGFSADSDFIFSMYVTQP